MGLPIQDDFGTVLFHSSSDNVHDALAEAMQAGVRSLPRAKLSRTSLQNPKIMHGVKLRGMDLHGANFEQCQARGASFVECNIENVDFGRSRMNYCCLDGSYGLNVAMTGAMFEFGTMRGVNISNLMACRCQMEGTNFSGSHINNSEFNGSSLQRAKFNGCNLKGTSFQRVNLYGASFIGANLEYCDFSNAVLVGCNFTRANLNGACFSHAGFDDGTEMGRIKLSWSSHDLISHILNEYADRPLGGKWPTANQIIRRRMFAGAILTMRMKCWRSFFRDGVDVDPEAMEWALRVLISVRRRDDKPTHPEMFKVYHRLRVKRIKAEREMAAATHANS